MNNKKSCDDRFSKARKIKVLEMFNERVHILTRSAFFSRCPNCKFKWFSAKTINTQLSAFVYTLNASRAYH